MGTKVAMGLRQYFQQLNLESLVMEENFIMVQEALSVWEGTTSKVPLVLSWIPITILAKLILLIKHLPIQGV